MRAVPGLLLVLIAAWLAGCAGVATVAGAPALPAALLQPPASLVRVPEVDDADLFAASDEMRHYVERELAVDIRQKGRQYALAEALARAGALRLEYDASQTRPAAATFADRRGNCLSLVIMTAALAQLLDLEVDFRVAVVDDSFSRHGDLVFASGHANITLGRRMMDRGRSGDDRTITIDFLPPPEVQGLRTRRMDLAELRAMYRNNRAAEALVDGRLGEAFAWARLALQARPGTPAAVNTLGVIHRLAGQPQMAALAFRQALVLAPANVSAMANLTGALTATGQTEEAERWRQQLAGLERRAPFEAHDLGRRAFGRGDYPGAVAAFRTALARQEGDTADAHFWLGLALHYAGDVVGAQAQWREAQALTAPRSAQRARYEAKLDRLRDMRPAAR